MSCTLNRMIEESLTELKIKNIAELYFDMAGVCTYISRKLYSQEETSLGERTSSVEFPDGSKYELKLSLKRVK